MTGQQHVCTCPACIEAIAAALAARKNPWDNPAPSSVLDRPKPAALAEAERVRDETRAAFDAADQAARAAHLDRRKFELDLTGAASPFAITREERARIPSGLSRKDRARFVEACDAELEANAERERLWEVHVAARQTADRLAAEDTADMIRNW